MKPKQNNTHSEGAGHGTLSRKVQRRADADAKQAQRDQRTDKQQLELLAARPGASLRESNRLMKKVLVAA